MRVINRYQKRRDSSISGSKFSTRNPTYWSTNGKIKRVNIGTNKIAHPCKKKENHKDTANKMEDQNGAADLKGSNI